MKQDELFSIIKKFVPRLVNVKVIKEFAYDDYWAALVDIQLDDGGVEIAILSRGSVTDPYTYDDVVMELTDGSSVAGYYTINDDEVTKRSYYPHPGENTYYTLARVS